MEKYVFRTILRMKEYNKDKYYIMPDYVKEIYVISNTMNDAIKGYIEALYNQYYITISKNALKHKESIYAGDGIQIGYLFTGTTEFENREINRVDVKQFIDVVTEISIIKNPFTDYNK